MSDSDGEGIVSLEGVGRSGEKDRKKAGRKQKPKPSDGYEKYESADIAYFLSEIEDNPILYDSSIDNCHRKEFLQKTYDRIEINCAKFMPRGKNSHGNTAKALWKQLLDAYNKYKKRVVSAASGSGIASLTEFRFAKEMEFIDTAAHKRQVQNTYVIGSRAHYFSEANKAEDSFTEKCIETMTLSTPKRPRSVDSEETPLFKRSRKEKQPDEFAMLMEQLKKTDDALVAAVSNASNGANSMTDKFKAVFDDHTKDWPEVNRYVAEAEVLSFIKSLKAPQQHSNSSNYSSIAAPPAAQYQDVSFSPSSALFHDLPSTSSSFSAGGGSQHSDNFDWYNPGY